MREFVENVLGYKTEKYKIKCNGRFREIDIYIPSLKIGIEYNGSAFHCTKNSKFNHNKSKYYHQEKFLLAKENGIRLITIFDKDYLENKESVLERIKYIITIGDINPMTDFAITDNDWGIDLSKFGYIEVGQEEPEKFSFGRENYIVFRCGKTHWTIPR